MKHFKSWDALAILCLAIAPWLVFWQASLGILAFAGGDISSFFYPVRVELARALAESRLPLWAPGMDAGFPLFAEGQVGALYLPNILLYRLFSIHLALNYSVLFHLSWASVGMFLFARISGLRVSSATLAGFAFCFSGFFFAHLQHLSLFATGAWLGWILFLQNRMFQAWRKSRRTWLFFALAAIAIGMQFLSGFPQIALFNLGAFVAIGVLGAFVNRLNAPVWQSILLTLGCMVLGLTLGAVQLLPTAELATLSTRGVVDEQFFSSYSLELSDLPQLISPYMARAEPLSDTQEFWGFAGISVLALALSALAVSRKAQVWFLFVFAALALAFALGVNNPLYSLLYTVPIFNRFRVPARFLFLFTFAIVNLAAISFDELQNRLRNLPDSTRYVRGLVILFVVAMSSIAFLKISKPFDFWMDAWTILPWFFSVGVLGLLVVAWRRTIDRAIFATAVLGLAIVELTAFIVPFLYTLDGIIPPNALITMPDVFQAMDETQPLYRLWTNNYGPGLRPNRPMAYGKQSAQIYSPLALERNDEYQKAMSSAMLNLIGVRYVMESDSIPDNVNVPRATLPTRLTSEELEFSPTRVTRVQIVSFTSGTASLSDGALAGQVSLMTSNDALINLPIRLGTETAEWNFDALAKTGIVKHAQPANTLPFVALLPVVAKPEGHKFVAQYSLSSPSPLVTRVAAHSSLKSGVLTVEQVTLFDEAGKSFSALSLSGRNDYSLNYIDPSVAMYENRDVLPRAFIVHDAQVESDDNVLVQMGGPAFNPSQTMFLSQGDTIHRSQASGVPSVDDVTVVEYRPERVMIRAKATEPGYLILADSWYPGWVASVDGQTAAIERADYIFRAVKLSPGDHQVVFEYRPKSFQWGAAISAFALAIAIGLIVFGAIRS